jgi:hypothetical protein
LKRLFVSEETVKSHVAAIFQLGVSVAPPPSSPSVPVSWTDGILPAGSGLVGARGASRSRFAGLAWFDPALADVRDAGRGADAVVALLSGDDGRRRGHFVVA